MVAKQQVSIEDKALRGKASFDWILGLEGKEGGSQRAVVRQAGLLGMVSVSFKTSLIPRP